MENRDYLIILYDFYCELLNDKQKEYFEDYYFNNLSLGEISENTGISRNAIHKSIKIVCEKLYFYEEKLNLYKKKQLLKEYISGLDDVNIKNKINELYQEFVMTNRKYRMYYDYRKRTSGGFFDVVFLVSIMITSFVMIFLAMIGGK